MADFLLPVNPQSTVPLYEQIITGLEDAILAGQYDDGPLPSTRRLAESLGVEVAITPEAGRLTAPLTDPSITPELLIRLREHGIAVDEITVSKPSLDEVFLTITGHGTDETDSAAAESATERSVA